MSHWVNCLLAADIHLKATDHTAKGVVGSARLDMKQKPNSFLLRAGILNLGCQGLIL